MREIIFKAKRIDNGEWVQGYLLKKYYQESPHDRFAIQYKTKGDEYEWTPKYMAVEIDESTLCQYTGLTDKNGNKIWENDVVERVDRRNGLYVFREQPKMNCKVVWTDRHGYDTIPSCGYFDIKNALECEVIGNVFDNPELIN